MDSLLIGMYCLCEIGWLTRPQDILLTFHHPVYIGPEGLIIPDWDTLFKVFVGPDSGKPVIFSKSRIFSFLNKRSQNPRLGTNRVLFPLVHLPDHEGGKRLTQCSFQSHI
jgi:hypothetical protein